MQENPISSDKVDTLGKLLALEPDTLDNLDRVTGWGRAVTQRALLQLIVDGRVTCRNRSGHRFYYVKPDTAATH